MTRSADYVRRHAETSTTGKWDTGGYTGDQIRAAVAAYIEGDDMPLTDDDVARIAAAVWNFAVMDDLAAQMQPASRMLRYTRSDANQAAPHVWNFQVMDDPSGQHQPASRVIRYIRSDTNTIRAELTEPAPGREQGAGDE